MPFKHRGEDHAHDARDNAHPRLAQPFRDGRGKAEQETTERREGHDDDRDLDLAQNGRVLLGCDQNGRHRARSGDDRNCHRYHRDRFA